jgi:hypothetical protein
MKKYFVLSIILIFLFSNFAIASSPVKRYKKPSTGKVIINMILWGMIGAGIGHLVNEKEGWKYGFTIGSLAVLARQSKLRIETQVQRTNWGLAEIAREYRITKIVRVKVTNSYDPSLKLEAERLLYEFGFRIIEENPDFQIEIHRKDVATSQSSYQSLGYTMYKAGDSDITLVVIDSAKRKHFLYDTGKYEYQQHTWDGYFSRWSYQDAHLMAARKALVAVIIQFVEKFGFRKRH